MTPSPRLGLRLVVILLAVVVCADLTLDAACDPIDLPGSAPGTAAISADTSSSDDACASFCVPDCFCCSRSETAAPAVTLPTPVVLAQAPVMISASVPSVVLPVLEPPPLALS